MVDIFERAHMKAARPMLPKVTPERLTEEYQSTPGEAFAAGAAQTNWGVGGYEFLSRKTTDDHEYDKEWAPGQHMLKDPKLNWVLKAAEADPDVFDAISQTHNQAEFEALVTNYERVKRHQVAMSEHTGAGIAGMVAGAIFDIPMLFAGPLSMANIVSKAAKAVELTSTARGLGGLTLGTVSAVENAAFEAMRGETDPTVGLQDYLQAGVLGGIVGGGLGALIPHRIGFVAEEMLAKKAKKAEEVMDRAALSAQEKGAC